MCNPVAVAGISAFSSLYQGYAGYQAARAQAAAAEANAGIADANAHDAILRGGMEETKMRRQAAMLRGAQRAAAAASGVVADAGSAAEVQDAAMRERERDIKVNALNAARERWGYQTQAQNYRAEAAAARAQGTNALIGGAIGAGTSLLSLASAGSAASRGGAGTFTPSKWYQANTDWEAMPDLGRWEAVAGKRQADVGLYGQFKTVGGGSAYDLLYRRTRGS